MTKREFREKVRGAGPNLTGEALEFAIGYHVEIGNTDSRHVSDCVQLAARYQESMPSRRDKRDGDAFFAFASTSIVGSEQLVERITPFVEDVRREVFGSTAPPFKEKQQAEDWLKETEKAQYRGDARQEWLELEDTLVYACEGGTLYTLAEAQKEIVKWTGFSERAVLAFILCGIAPVRPRYRFMPYRFMSNVTLGKLNRRKVMIEVNEVLNREDLTVIQKRVRKFFVKDNDLLASKDWLVMQAVNKLGGVPTTGKIAFWEKVAQECNRQRPGTYKNYEGPRKRYLRMQKQSPGRKPASSTGDKLE